MKRSAPVVGWILIGIVVAIVVVATPFLVYLIYAMTCKGSDCFR